MTLSHFLHQHVVFFVHRRANRASVATTTRLTRHVYSFKPSFLIITMLDQHFFLSFSPPTPFLQSKMLTMMRPGELFALDEEQRIAIFEMVKDGSITIEEAHAEVKRTNPKA